MDAVATYQGIGRNLAGDLTITFSIEEDPQILEKIEALKDQDLLLEISKLSKKHSDQARKYMWKLCDLIAKALKSDKDTIYLMMLRQAGVFEYIEIPRQEADKIKPFFRCIEEIGSHDLLMQSADGEWITTEIAHYRCYKGMHDYSSKELSDLIDQIVETCNTLGIPTITEDEFRRLAGI